MDNTSHRVIQYDSWTEWNISSNIEPSTIIYTGHTVECPMEEIRVKYKTSKYIIVLTQE
jgi:hypothetical protein